MRFRKSIRVAKGVRINLSKSGIGMSAGTKGFRVGVGPKGVYRSIGIPGTGLYSVDYMKSGSGAKKESVSAKTIAASATTGAPATQLYKELPTIKQMGLASPHTFGFWATAIIVTLLFRSSCGVFAGAAFVGLWAINRRRECVRLGQVYDQARIKVIGGRFQEASELLNGLAGKVSPELLALVQGHCCLGANDEVGAIEHYLIYLDAGVSRDPRIAIRCASLLMKNSRPSEALPLLESLPEPYRTEPLVIGMKGGCLLETGKPELAVEVLKTAPLRKRTPDPVLTTIRYSLGKAYKALGQDKKAATQFRRVYADDPTFQDIQEIVGAVQSDEEEEPENR